MKNVTTQATYTWRCTLEDVAWVQDIGNTTQLLQCDYVHLVPRQQSGQPAPRWPKTLCVFCFEPEYRAARVWSLAPYSGADPLSRCLYLPTHELRLVMHVLFPPLNNRAPSLTRNCCFNRVNSQTHWGLVALFSRPRRNPNWFTLASALEASDNRTWQTNTVWIVE